jgi:hypothetical protein
LSVNISRPTLLWSLLALLLVWGAWHLYAGWGLVTINVDNAPLSRVLSEIRKQGGIEIVSNLDPTTKVSLHVKRVPAVEALDVVAVRTDASWRLAYLGAPAQAPLDEALTTFAAGGEIADWTSHGAGGFSLVEPESGEALDLRRVQWTPAGGGKLSDVLQEAAEKTGVLLAAPSAWSPDVDPPAPGPIASAAPELFRQAGGVSREIFLLRGRGGSGEDDGPGDRRGGWIGTAPDSRGERGGGWMRAMGDPERVAARVEAQIALLPAAEQPKARENFQMMREFWQSVRDLPEEERRAKAREFFSRPEVAEDMETRRLSRWAKMTPDQRIERNKNYWERKSEARRESR